MSKSRYCYQPIIDRPRLLWPGNASVALWVIPNIEYYPFGNLGPALNQRAAEKSPDVLNNSWRDYGARVGIWRLFECLDSVGVKVSATLNSAVCDHYPRIVEEASSRNWEWIGHGTDNTIRQTGLTLEDERALVHTATTRIADATGRRPRGWLGPGLAETPDTPEVLLQEGYQYVCDWVCDDLPFWLSATGGRLLSMPYSIELNDMELLFRQRQSGPEYLQSLVDHFHQLLREAKRQGRGRVMAIPLHPFLTGQARFTPYLKEALERIVDCRDTWSATGEEIMDHYIGTPT